MNLLKSLFVSLYMMAAMVITVVAVRSLMATHDYITWGGVILVTGPFVLVLSRIMIFKNTARTSARFPMLIVLGAVGTVLASWGYVKGGSSLAPVLALAGLVGFLAYDYWYSSFNDRASSQLSVGNMLPEFELLDTSGSIVTSASLTDKPAVWIFYRGNWCPLCMAQIKEIAGQYRQLQDMGARVALISPQPHKFTIGLARKFDVAFDFLTDENNHAARTLGIDSPNGIPMGMQVLGYDRETVLPTVIITDTGGRILWAHETDNYRVRPDPDVYLAVLRENMAEA
ncbi:MAG: redoxin domain-containing protein [Desulfobulbaceae bacterium]|nr:redoxin domain-containing protein [Desulfobulbaceae bacterium]